MGVEFKYNKNGQLEAYENGKKVGLIETNDPKFDSDTDFEEEKTYELNKIKTLLKRYGASDKEIKNFIEDLENFIEEQVEEVKEEFDNDNDFENWK